MIVVAVKLFRERPKADDFFIKTIKRAEDHIGYII